MSLLLMRARMAARQTHIYELENVVAKAQHGIDYHKEVCAIYLAVGGQWPKPWPHELFAILMDYLRPSRPWVSYPPLTMSTSDPLLPHDPLHSHRDDFPWDFHIPEAQERIQLQLRDEMLDSMENVLGTMRAAAGRKMIAWAERHEYHHFRAEGEPFDIGEADEVSSDDEVSLEYV